MNPSSSKELKLRQYILEEKLWKVILYITYPLAIYSLFNHLYGFVDMMIVAHIGNTQIASVAILSEIQTMITAFGAGIASGGAVIVARHIGANRLEEAKKNASNVFFLAVYVSLFLIILLIPTAKPFLQLLRTPSGIIEDGLGYFIVQIITTGFITINSVFIGLEKAKGNTQKILWLNIIIMTIKLILSVIFVYGFNLGILWVSIATMIAQAFLTLFAFMILFSKNNPFKITFSEMRLKWSYIKPILLLSLPIFLGRFIFSTGRLIINAMAAVYGTEVLSAFSIAQKIGGGGATLANVTEEAVPTVIAQNIGNDQQQRAKRVYPIALGIGVTVGVITVLYAFLFKDQIIPLIVNKETTPEFIKMTITLFRWEVFSKLNGAIIAITLAMFYGYRHTKVAMVVNMARLFVFRIPVLWAFQTFFDFGYESIGFTMFISNLSTALLSLVLAFVFYMKMRNNPNTMTITN
ncbi:MATE family efflux transporter [Acholeplasma vituli]|uniref:MATE family efflux transporter n=1 Tax=Paracholeplasma vituli TaxID=69473 RepID=A0ABT2PTF4_9MOLU|nr:MATE family efflux transporter [Paracholeplasma vituli]MCU0104217.1 MATE family efflux transporter [Paracholeplasma vituli]